MLLTYAIIRLKERNLIDFNATKVLESRYIIISLYNNIYIQESFLYKKIIIVKYAL
jgi:hypothetical protein